MYPPTSAGWTIAFSIVLGIIVLGFFSVESWRYARLPPPGNFTRVPDGVPDDAAGRYTGELPDEASENAARAGSTRQFLSTATKRSANGTDSYDLAAPSNGNASNGNA